MKVRTTETLLSVVPISLPITVFYWLAVMATIHSELTVSWGLTVRVLPLSSFENLDLLPLTLF